MPQIVESFVVDKPLSIVWDFFQQVPQIAECMPGVELVEDLGNNAYKGKMKVKLGPIAAQFLGEAEITDLREAGHTGSISAKGVDRQGGSRASAKVQFELTSASEGTLVEIKADLILQGSMAQFGRTGLIQEVSSQLTKEFAACIEKKLSAATRDEAAGVHAGEVKGLRLFVMSFWAWLKRLFTKSRDS